MLWSRSLYLTLGERWQFLVHSTICFVSGGGVCKQWKSAEKPSSTFSWPCLSCFLLWELWCVWMNYMILFTVTARVAEGAPQIGMEVRLRDRVTLGVWRWSCTLSSSKIIYFTSMQYWHPEQWIKIGGCIAVMVEGSLGPAKKRSGHIQVPFPIDPPSSSSTAASCDLPCNPRCAWRWGTAQKRCGPAPYGFPRFQIQFGKINWREASTRDWWI